MSTGLRPVNAHGGSPTSRSGFTELHFVPRCRHGKGQPGRVVGLPSLALGAADWALIDPLPFRKSKGVPRSTIPALYAWLRYGHS